MACSNAKTGGTDGTCANVSSGTDPDNDCSPGVCDAGVCIGEQGDACLNPSDCLSTNCVDDFCCDTGCPGNCKACSNAKTGAADGTCTDVSTGTDPDNECTPGACNGSGLCKFEQGDFCAIPGDCLNTNCIDGFCCDTGCATSCMACSNAKTGGTDGTCADVTTGTDPDNDCSPGACAGAGVCKGEQGDVCVIPGDCLNNNCADGFCCDTACSSSCKACSNAKTGGTDGTCADVTYDTDPDNDCSGNECCQTGVCGGSAC